MRLRSFAIVASVFVLAIPALASSELERLQLATALGNILASEGTCGLTYKQDAIRKFIDSKVPADDMSFAGDLSAGTSVGAYTLKKMSESAKTAHCRQIERVAKSYGFI